MDAPGQPDRLVDQYMRLIGDGARAFGILEKHHERTCFVSWSCNIVVACVPVQWPHGTNIDVEQQTGV